MLPFSLGSISARTSSIPRYCGHRLRRGAAVASEHDDFDAVGVQELNRFRRARFDWIGHAENAGRVAIDRNKHHRLAIAAQRFGAIE